jgi:hypothetical protein
MGRRYDSNSGAKLNLKKVFAVIIAIVVIIMIILMVKNLLFKESESNNKISSASYFALFADEKWGVIDNTGNQTIAPSYKEMIIVPNSKKDVFLCTYDVDEETGEYKTKALNSKNEEIFTEYEQVEAIENYDSNNNVWYEDNVLKVKKDGKYGLIDLSGRTLAACEYDSITPITGIKNSLVVEKDGKYGLLNDEGTIILKAENTKISAFGDDYKDGYIVQNEDNKCGVIDYLGKQILLNKFEEVYNVYGKDYFYVKSEGEDVLVNKDNYIVLENGFDEITQIVEESSQTGVVFTKNKKYGFMDKEGNVTIEAKYDDLKEVQGVFIASEDGKYGIIAEDGSVKIDFQYANIEYNKQADIYIAEDESYQSYIIDNEFNVQLEGILSTVNTDKGYLKIKIDDEIKYYNFKFEEKQSKEILTSNTLYLSKKDGKYGFVDKDGQVVVDYIYDDATEQNDLGYSAVKKDGLWGSIDSSGKVVIEPVYNLDNNFVIDFVGKWHLGQDINMNYYCEK